MLSKSADERTKFTQLTNETVTSGISLTDEAATHQSWLVEFFLSLDRLLLRRGLGDLESDLKSQHTFIDDAVRTFKDENPDSTTSRKVLDATALDQ